MTPAKNPVFVVPTGVTDAGDPVSITFTGRLYGETELLAVALESSLGRRLIEQPSTSTFSGGWAATSSRSGGGHGPA